MNLLEIVVRGGWVMIPIALVSLVVIALGVARYLTLRRERRELADFLGSWEQLPKPLDRERFLGACRSGPVSVQVLAAILDENSRPRHLSARLETAARGAMARLEAGLGTMATMAAVAPLLGFLGTVTGMIRAFMQIQNLGGNVNASVLAGGIWEALITTAAGLIVGIPALLIHNYLSGLVHSLARQLEQCAELIVQVAGGGDES